MNAVTGQPALRERIAFPPYKLAALVDAAGASGVSSDAVLEGTGVDAHTLADPQTRTSIDQYLTACGNAIRLSDDAELPFKVGERLHLSAYGIYGFALLCSPTVREGFKLAVRFHGLATPVFPIAWRETPEHFIWDFPDEGASTLPPHLKRFLMAQQLAQHVTHMRDISGPGRRPTRISIAMSDGSDADAYERHLLCPVEFGAPRTEIYYDHDVLDDQPPLTNRGTLAMLLSRCESLIASVDSFRGVSADVARLLMERTERFPSMPEVAAEFRMTSRTLRRRLSGEGKTFSGILDEVRQKLAIRYLESADLTVVDIAYLLGFEDVANFRRAFRRWTGKAPVTYRRTAEIDSF